MPLQIQTLDNLNTGQDALQNASEYYGKLPSAKSFLMKYCLKMWRQKDD